MTTERLQTSVDSLIRAVARTEREPGGDLVGRSVGRFELIACIGRGATSSVYQAFDPRLQRHVAVKVMRRIGTQTHQEARAGANLPHPNIAGVYEAGEAGDLCYIVLELLTGVTLRAALGARLATPTILGYAGQLARGLAFAHAHGVVHGDIKPENLMVDHGGVVKLLDFGLAHDGTVERTARGTPGYMGPELARESRSDARADLYAAGVVIAEMMLAPARLPRDAATLRAAIRGAHRRPKRLRQLVERCLADLPAERPRDGGALVTALATVASRGRTCRRMFGLAVVTGCIVAVAATPRAPARHAAPVLARFAPAETIDERGDIALSADGDELAYISDGRLFVQRRDEGGARPIGSATKLSAVSWFADGQHFAVAADAGTHAVVSIVDRQTGTSRAIAEVPEPVGTFVQVSPDQASIACLLVNRGELRIYARSGALRQTISLEPGRRQVGVAWAPDASRLVIATLRANGERDPLRLRVFDVITGIGREVWRDRAPSTSESTAGVAWMRDGSLLVATSSSVRDGTTLHRISPAGGDAERLAQLPGRAAVALSAASRVDRIAFVAVAVTPQVLWSELDLVGGRASALTAMTPNGEPGHAVGFAGDGTLWWRTAERDVPGRLMRQRPGELAATTVLTDLTGDLAFWIDGEAATVETLWLRPGGAATRFAISPGPPAKLTPLPGGAPIELARSDARLLACGTRPAPCVAVDDAGDQAELVRFDPATARIVDRLVLATPIEALDSLAVAGDAARAIVVPARASDLLVAVDFARHTVTRIPALPGCVPHLVALIPRDPRFVEVATCDGIESAFLRSPTSTQASLLWRARQEWWHDLQISPDRRRAALTSFRFALDVWTLDLGAR